MSERRIPMADFMGWLEQKEFEDTFLEHTEKIALGWLREGKPLKQVYCWFYGICMQCGDHSWNHMDDWKCPFAPTHYTPAF